MNIVYFISTVGHGKGGHFHSLNTIANAIGRTENVYVINIGLKLTDVLDQVNYKAFFVKYNGYNFFSVYLKLKNLIESLQPDAIHAFDVESFAFSRLFSKLRNQPSYLNKCGGPNPTRYYPKADVIVLFSKENLDYFSNNKRYLNSKFSLIPNRVKAVRVDAERIDLFHKRYGMVDTSILRIARIGNHYYNSIIQAINLLDFLKNKGMDVRLIVIGTIQSEAVYTKIRNFVKFKNLENEVILETSEVFTHNASELLAVGDVIVGTGRNFMEASSLNKVLLVPYVDSDFPLFVTEDNFNEVFATNFSPRTQLRHFNKEANLELLSTSALTHRAAESLYWFNSFFNVDKGAKLYIELYEKVVNYSNDNFIDVILNGLYSFKTFTARNK